jgi:hypothetical protein
MYCRSQPQCHFDLDQIFRATFAGMGGQALHVLGAAAPHRCLATLRCVQLLRLVAATDAPRGLSRPTQGSVYQGSVPDVPRMTEGHHLRRREASFTAASVILVLDGTDSLVPRMVVRDTARALSSYGDDQIEHPLAAGAVPNPASGGLPSQAVKHHLKLGLPAILVAPGTRSNSPATPVSPSQRFNMLRIFCTLRPSAPSPGSFIRPQGARKTEQFVCTLSWTTRVHMTTADDCLPIPPNASIRRPA